MPEAQRSEPPPAPGLSLAEQVRELASKMADSVGCSIADVLRRTKSRSWILGRIKRLCEGRTDEEIREVIVGLASQHRPVAQDELLERLHAAKPEAPARHIRGLEPVESGVWAARAEQLGPCLVYPMDMPELLRHSAIKLKWSRNFTIQTASAAEDVGELWWDGRFWQRTQERIMASKNGRVEAKRVIRTLTVVLRPEDHPELRERARVLDEERRELEEELAEQAKSLRARIREKQESREKVVQAILNGKEKRPVDCEERWDYTRKEVTVVRKDTGEVVESPRPMTSEELQLRIPSEATAS